MQKETYELFETKFLNECSLEEKQFLKEIASYRETHITKAKENKEKYFDNNLLLISLLSGNKIFKLICSILIATFPTIGITKLIKKCLEILSIAISTEMNFVIMICVGAVVLVACICILFLLEKKQKELPFRRYGETWIRHTIALSGYDAEMLKYMYNLDYYKEKEGVEQRKLFMEKILEIEMENMDKFEKNMSKIQ